MEKSTKMSVLNKLTKESRKKLNRCFKDRPYLLTCSPIIDNEQCFVFDFNSSCGEFRNLKRILGTLYYLISREKINETKDFIVHIQCMYDYISFYDNEEANNNAKNKDKFIIFSEFVKSNESFSLSNLDSFKKLSKIFNPLYGLNLVFTFYHEKKVISVDKMFKSEFCVICMVKEPDFYFIDCGHLCVCRECFEDVTNLRNFHTTCPLCKTMVNNFATL